MWPFIRKHVRTILKCLKEHPREWAESKDASKNIILANKDVSLSICLYMSYYDYELIPKDCSLNGSKRLINDFEARALYRGYKRWRERLIVLDFNEKDKKIQEKVKADAENNLPRPVLNK